MTSKSILSVFSDQGNAKTLASQKVNPRESQQIQIRISSQLLAPFSVIHRLPPDCYSSFVTSKCLRFPKVGSSLTGWSLQQPETSSPPQKSILNLPVKLWVSVAVPWEAEHPVFCLAVLYYRNRALHTKIKWWGKHVFAPITNVVYMCMGVCSPDSERSIRIKVNEEEGTAKS